MIAPGPTSHFQWAGKDCIHTLSTNCLGWHIKLSLAKIKLVTFARVSFAIIPMTSVHGIPLSCQITEPRPQGHNSVPNELQFH